MKKLFLIFIALFSAPASAQTLDSSFVAWSVFTIMQEGNKVCYATSAPVAKDYKKERDEPYALVTFRNATTTEVSISSGYPFKDGSVAKLSIGNTPFELFTSAETPKLAWAKDRKSDQTIIERMLQSENMLLEGVAVDGTPSKDGYDLKGFPDAYKKIRSLCMKKENEPS